MMYIRITKSPTAKDLKVYLVEGYRDQNGRNQQRILRSYGNLSDLTKENPDALEELKAWAKKETENQKANRHISLELDMSELRCGDQIPLNYGYVFLEAIYNELRISEFMNNYQAKTNVSYSLDNILKLLLTG